MISSAIFAVLVSVQGPAWNASSIFQRSLQVNPAATSALQAVVQAQQRVAEIAAQRRMQLTFSGSASENRGTQSASPSNVTFQTYQGTISLPFPNGRRIQAQALQAEAQLRVAQAGLQRTRLDLAFRSSDAYLGVLRTRGAQQIAEQSLEQAQRQVADAEKRVAAGDLAASEVLKAQVPEAQARAALSRAKSAVRVAEATLNSLVGGTLADVPALTERVAPPTRSLALESAHEEARQHSPDVQEAEAGVSAAEGALAEARRSRDADVTLQASHTHTTDPTTYTDLTSLNLSFDLPLSDGGVARRQINQAVAALNQAKAARDTALQAVDLAVEQAYLDVQAQTQNLSATQETLTIAEESYQKAVQAYNAGLTTTRDVLDAGLALSQAKNDVNSATYDLALAQARLDQVMGREPQG